MSGTSQPTQAVAGRHVVEVVAAALGGSLLAVLMTWPLALRLGSDIPRDLGDPLFQAWQVAWIGHAVAHQPLHLYQANLFWPLADTLAFSDALIGYAPAGLIAQIGPHAALVTYDLLFLFAYALAFAGTYLLARELGAGRAGAVLAGAAFAYAPWRLAQSGHLQVISSGGIPLALALLVRGYRRRSAPLLLGGWLVATWQLTLGFTLGLQLAYLLAVLGVIVAIVWLRRGREPVSRTIVAASAVGACLFLGVALLQARPYLRVTHDHPESERTPSVVASFSPTYGGFVAAPPESFVWGDVTARRREAVGFGIEHTLFPGLTVLLLAALGLAGDVYSKRLRIGLGLGVVVCAVLSVGLRDVAGLGRYITPYRLLYELAPGWDAVRTPGRINTLTSLGLALLAAAGLSWILGVARRRAGARVVRAVGALAVTAVLVEGLGPIPHERVPEPPSRLDAAGSPRLHLPMDFDFGSRYAYWTVGDFAPIVNGNGAFEPTLQRELQATIENFPDAHSVEALRSLGVRAVVVHPDMAVGTSWEGVADRPVAGLPLTRTADGPTVVYRLAPQE